MESLFLRLAFQFFDKTLPDTVEPRQESAPQLRRANQGTIQLRSTSTGKTRDLVVKGWSGLMGGHWSGDGRSLFTTSHSHEGDSTLLNVTLDGRVSVLLHSRNEVFSAIPSPDGRSLAITEDSGAKNVWEIENF
jgi:hypothetical protein